MKMWISIGDTITETKSYVQGQYSDAAYNELVTLGHPLVNRLTQMDVPDFDTTKIDMVGQLYVNPQTNEVWYEYTSRPLTADELKEQRIANLEVAMAQMLGM